VLRRATLQIDSGLQSEPAVRGALLTTLGEVYTSLGSYETSAKLLASASSIVELADNDRTSLKIAKGNLHFWSGDYGDAISAYSDAVSQSTLHPNHHNLEIERAKIWLANTLAASGKNSDARSKLIAQIRSIPVSKENFDLLAYAMVALGSNEFLAGNHVESISVLDEALKVRQLASGPLHPDFAVGLNLLASANYRIGRKGEAERIFREVLAIDERVLGKDHPANAIKQNNIARIVIEQRKFQEAETLLSQSEQILTKQLTPDHDDFAFVYSNIALAKRGLGDDATAETYLQKTLPIARKHQHRTLGLALADLAEIECRTGRVAQGLARLDEALMLAAAIKPPEPWRAAYVEHIGAACTLATKSPLTPSERTDAVASLRASGEIVVKHWTAEGLYGYDAAQRMKKYTK
jgi:tetratricopeptide (TPR) repeat protein